MKPVSPTLLKHPGMTITIGKDSKEYLPLPAVLLGNKEGVVITRWHLPLWERLRLLWHGSLYLSVMTFKGNLQPFKLELEEPELPDA